MVEEKKKNAFQKLKEGLDDKEVYDEALKKAQENWNRAIQNRLQGRALAKILNSIRKK